jgi:hypothetical protein
MSKTFPKQIDKNFDVAFSSTFLVLSRFRVFLSDGSSKTLQHTFCKQIVSKGVYNKIRAADKIDASPGPPLRSVKTEGHSKTKRRTPTWLVGSSEAKKEE